MAEIQKTFNRRVKKLLQALGAAMPILLFIFGAAAISFGAAMIYPPAGAITAGVLAIICGVLMIKGGETDE